MKRAPSALPWIVLGLVTILTVPASAQATVSAPVFEWTWWAKLIKVRDRIRHGSIWICAQICAPIRE